MAWEAGYSLVWFERKVQMCSHNSYLWASQSHSKSVSFNIIVFQKIASLQAKQAALNKPTPVVTTSGATALKRKAATNSDDNGTEKRSKGNVIVMW